MTKREVSEGPEGISMATAHRINGHLQGIAAAVALLRMAGSDAERAASATSQILERTREIASVVSRLVRE